MKTKLLALGALFASLCISVQGQLVDKTPVLHLSFDKVSGTTAGSIVTNSGTGGSGMNGTLNGSAVIQSGGKFGNCLSISGADSSSASVRIANAVVPLNVGAGNNWTVAMWIQTSTAGGCYAYQGDGGWAPDHTTFYLNNGSGTGGHAGGVRYGQGWEQGTPDINDGAWHHVVITCNGTTKVLYLDGNVDAFFQTGYNGDSWSAAGSGAQFWVGGAGNTGDGTANLNGLVDEVYVFNQTLSLSDIQSLTNNTLPIVPVSATANPASGYRGQFFTLTATVTPGAGTVTNVTANLSAINLSAAANMVLSSANVFTNSFTVPATAPVGARSLIVTAKTDTAPFIGSGGATFTVVARPPTNAIIVTQLTNVSAYEYTKASFYFGTTNDAPNDAPFPMTYAWYTNGVLVSTNPMGPHYSFLTTLGDNGAQISAIARVADTNFSSLAVTSAVVTLTVNSGTPVFTNGLKQELFAGATRADVEIGNVGPGIVSLISNADSTGGFGNNHARRYSGYFIPPTTDGYVFFVAADDDTDVFLSTNSSPAHKRLIAQEAGYSGTRNWQTPGGNGSTVGQKRSDQWSPDGGTTVPYSAGIQLLAGQKYYFESVIHNGSGGDNWGVTYETLTELTADGTQPVDGSASRMTAASNNIAVITWPGTNITWTLQPVASITVYEGATTNFSAIAVSDAEMTLKYQWRVVTNGGALPGTPLTGLVVNGTNFAMSLIPANYNNAQIYCVASTEFGGLSITSSVCTLTVIQSVFEPGFVSEKKWMDAWIQDAVNAGTAPAPTFSCVRAGFEAGLDNPGAQFHDATIQQIGYFVAPTSGNYVFFITSHDDGDLFLSTDNTPANKRLVAQEAGWSGNFAWNQAGGGGTVVSQKRSDQYSPDSGVTTPYATGIPLTAGGRYYMEVTHNTSRWGNEQHGVTYRVMDEFSSVTAPDDGSLPNCNGTNVGMSAIRCSYVAITKQPSTAGVTVVEGSSAAFSVAGTSDSQYPVCSSYGLTITAPTNTLFCQWYKILSGVTNAIPGATATVLTTGPLTTADNGARFYCAVRALGYADNSLNRIWTNSQTSGAITVTARTPSLLGHWVSGAASLADSANYVAPGVYDGGVVAGGQYYFTNDVPPGAQSGAQALYLQGTGIVISNTASSDAGYTVGTFDANIQSQCTVAFWAKGIPGGWNPWVSKYGDSGQGWQLRVNNGGNSCWTIRGTGGNDDMGSIVTVDTNWHYYAGTFDAVTGTRNLYVDGVLDVTQTGEHAYTVAGPSHLMLGGRDNGGNNFGNFFTGSLYDVRIYNYPLTQQEVISVGHVALTFTSEIVPGGAGSQLVITWPLGILLQATNVLGPWTTNSTVSPATIDMTAPQMFFRTQSP